MILKPYAVRPRQTAAGSFYLAAAFNDAWERYLPPLEGASAISATGSENVINVRDLKRVGNRAASTLQVPAYATNGTCGRSDGTSWQMACGAQAVDAESKMAVVADETDDAGELL